MRKTKRAKIWRAVAIVLIIYCLGTMAQGKYGGGTGEPNDPYQIWDANHMQAIGADPCDWDKCFVLMADIDLVQFIGDEFNIIGYRNDWSDYEPFTGVFDGNNHTISNFTWDSVDSNNVGLFACVGRSDNGGEIKNLELLGINLNGGETVGGLVGFFWKGIITDCCSEGNVVGSTNVGGLVGQNYDTIQNCSSACNLVGWLNLGGLVGGNGGTIANCSASGNIEGRVEDRSDSVGGLVGMNQATIINCSATGSVSAYCAVGGLVGDNRHYVTHDTTITKCRATGNVLGAVGVGGLVGGNTGPVMACYASGSAEGGFIQDNGEVGGLVGSNGGQITFCYAIGNVLADNRVGGLVGSGSGTISNSYWDIETSNEHNMCGYQDDPNCDNSYGKTTSEMHQQSTFTDWDFINVWDIAEDQTYPYLRIVPASDINKDHITNFLDLCIVAEQWMNEE